MADKLADLQRQANLAGRSEARDRLAADWVHRRFTEFDAMRERFVRNWVIWSNAFEGDYPRAYYAGRSNITPPDLKTLTKRLAPRVAQTSMAGRFFEAAPSSLDLRRKQRDVEDLLLWQLERQRFRQRFGEEFDQEAIILGTSVSKKVWWKEVDTRRRIRAVSSSPVVDSKGPRMASKYAIREKEEVSFHGPKDYWVDLFRIWFNPYCSGDDLGLDGTDVIEKHPVTAAWIRRMEKQGHFPSKVVDEALEQGARGGTQAREEWDRSRNRNGYPERLSDENHEYCEFWGLFPIGAKVESYITLDDLDKEDLKECRIGILDEKFVVMLEENPHDLKKKPYFLNRLWTRKGDRYGISLVGTGLDIAIAIKDTLNQTLDAGTLANIPMMLADGPRGQASYTWGMGKVLRGANLRAVQFNDNTMSGFRRVEILRRMLEDLFAAPPLLSGQELGGEGGATGAAIQDQQAAMNLRSYAQAKEDNFLKPALAFQHAMNEQMLDDEVRIVVQGSAGFEQRYIRRDDILGSYDFVMKGRSQQESRERMGAAFTTLTQSFLLIEQQAQRPIMNWPRFVEKALTDVLHEDNPERFMADGATDGPELSPIQNLILVASGRRVKIDMRQDFTKTLPQTVAIASQIVNETAEEDIKTAIGEYLAEMRAAADRWAALKRQELMRQKQEQLEIATAEAEKQGRPVGSAGGPQNAQVGPMDRDGQGLGTGRMLMKGMVPGAL